MKKIVLGAVTLVLGLTSWAQAPHSLSSPEYFLSTGGKDFVKHKEYFSITYDRNYCIITTGTRVIEFPVAAFTSKLEDGRLREGFLSNETGGTEYGWYSIDANYKDDYSTEV